MTALRWLLALRAYLYELALPEDDYVPEEWVDLYGPPRPTDLDVWWPEAPETPET